MKTIPRHIYDSLTIDDPSILQKNLLKEGDILLCKDKPDTEELIEGKPYNIILYKLVGFDENGSKLISKNIELYDII